ncbi:MAG: SUMF1/EgtB/PvdO family nonheme iron enzyme [Lewinellaceae bacterium]|nr:SUMF1/EgtB/PvdO family nonheme iron enzyme [Lewinellaceae bacterium]
MSDICRAVSLQKNFIVKASNVENAMALMDADGHRMILYSTLFLEKFKADTRTRWAAYSVLAHEIGHHLNHHRFDESDPARRRILELQADEFSGGVLRLLGAPLNDSKAGVESFAQEAESPKYPSGRARLEAVTRGWINQDDRLGSIDPVAPPVRPAGPDTDGDGVPDATDKCRDEYGLAKLDGCPDGDGDGIPDHEDKCKYQPGPAKWLGCPDTDGDGIPDHEDTCPTVPGLPERKGCPPADRDGDGVPDQSDKCADKAGLKQFQGCPDTDGDGVPDHEDDCPTEAGLPALRGCREKTATPAKPRAGDVAADGLVFVAGGAYTMGCTTEQGSDCAGDEKPAHRVTVPDFYIGKYEVTNEEFCRFLNAISNNITFSTNGDEVSYKGQIIFDMFCGDKKGGCSGFTEMIEYDKGNRPGGRLTVVSGYERHPLVLVSWHGATEYCKWLSTDGKNYRLPTEAEWEYTARGGSLSGGYKYSGSNSIDEVAWYTSNSGSKTHQVGGKKANELGLHDMSGNVREWVEDDWHDSYQSAPTTGMAWTGTSSRGGYRVGRGGSWYAGALHCRVADRRNDAPTIRGYSLGFRLCRSF